MTTHTKDIRKQTERLINTFQTAEYVDEILKSEMKATEQYFSVVLFVVKL